MPHLVYSPDLAPSDYYLLWSMADTFCVLCQQPRWSGSFREGLLHLKGISIGGGSEKWQKSDFRWCNIMASTVNTRLFYCRLKNKANKLLKFLTHSSLFLVHDFILCRLFYVNLIYVNVTIKSLYHRQNVKQDQFLGGVQLVWLQCIPSRVCPDCIPHRD